MNEIYTEIRDNGSYELRKKESLFRVTVVTLFTMIVGDITCALLLPAVPESAAYWHTFMLYASFIGTWIAVLTVSSFPKNRYIKGYIYRNNGGNRLSYLFYGFAAGMILNGLSAVVAYLHGDIKIIFNSFEILPVTGLFFAVFIQSSAEEVLCRGFMYQRLLNGRKNAVTAVVVNSLVFAVLHLGNDGISVLGFYDLLVTGIFFSLLVFYYDSLWLAMGVHTTWNFTQSILLGLPNSGTNVPYSVFMADHSAMHNSFAYSTEFGLEGTILSSVIMTLCCAGLFILKNKDKKLWDL